MNWRRAGGNISVGLPPFRRRTATRAGIGLLAVLLFVPGLASAQTTVAGNWDVTINSPQGASTSLVTFKQDGDKVSGILKVAGAASLPFERRHAHRQRSEVLLHDQAHQGMERPDHADRARSRAITMAARPTSRRASPRATGPRSARRRPRMRRAAAAATPTTTARPTRVDPLRGHWARTASGDVIAR